MIPNVMPSTRAAARGHSCEGRTARIVVNGVVQLVLSGAILVSGCGVAKPAPCAGPHCPAADAAIAADAAATDAVATDAQLSSLITVTTTTDQDGDDGLCSLAEALAAAETGRAVNSDDCPGGAPDVVILLGGGTYSVKRGLHPRRSLEIRGAGMRVSLLRAVDNPAGCAVTVSDASATVRLTNLTLDGADSNGLAGVCVTAGELWMRHVRVTGFGAGGVLTRGSTSIFNSLIDGNSSAVDGAGIALAGDAARLFVEQSAIVNNVSQARGGGVFATGVGLNSIKNTTISGNSARRGGGVAILMGDGGYLALYSTTVAHNRASEAGGGLFQQAADGVTVNTILNGDVVANNVADADPVQNNLNADWGSQFTCTSSLFHVGGLPRPPPNVSDSCLYDVADARLGPLMNMGGLDGLPLHALLPDSPAVDAVDATGSAERIEQRDPWSGSAGDPQLGWGPGDTPPWTLFGRPHDGDGDGRADEDMGAFELNPRWESELLARTDPPGQQAASVVVTDPGAYSHDAGINLPARGAGAQVTFSVPTAQPGKYAVRVGIKAAPTAGQFQVSLADPTGAAFVPLGPVQEGHAPTAEWRSAPLGPIEISAPGAAQVRFEMTGRNPASAGYELFVDFIELSPLSLALAPAPQLAPRESFTKAFRMQE